MTPAEQAAFVQAYGNHVGDMPDAYVADYVARYKAGEKIPYGEGHTSILDALGMWHEAIKWQMEQTKEALTLSLAELHRHATDTESGEKAIAAVEGALK